MKVERSSVDQVKARFSMNKKKMEEKKKEYDLEQRVSELREEVVTFLTVIFDVYALTVFHRKSTFTFINEVRYEKIKKSSLVSLERITIWKY